MRPLVHPATEDIELTAVLYALADPVRLSIVRRLACSEPLSCTNSCDDDALPRATLSRHYDALRAAGLVKTVKSGTQYLNTLRSDDINGRFPGLLSAVLGSPAPTPATSAKPRRARAASVA